MADNEEAQEGPLSHHHLEFTPEKTGGGLPKEKKEDSINGRVLQLIKRGGTGHHHAFDRTARITRLAINVFNLQENCLRQMHQKMTTLGLQASLPVSAGDLGIRRAVNLAIPTFLAPYHSSLRLVESLLPNGSCLDPDAAVQERMDSWTHLVGQDLPTLDMRGLQTVWDTPVITHLQTILQQSITNPIIKARYLAAFSKESGAWLHALPSPSLGLHLSNECFRISAALRLGAAVCEPHSCCKCGAPVDQLGLHGFSCLRMQEDTFCFVMNDNSCDSENEMQVEECSGGRKSKSKIKKGVGQSKKRTIISNKEPRIKCSHGMEVLPSCSKAKGKKQCMASELCYEDITQFHHHVTSLNKTDQDKYILKFMAVSSPKRRVVNTENLKRKKTVSVKYTIRKKNGEVVPVCAASFQGVSGMSKDRLSYLASRFHSGGKLPKEMRGGDRTGKDHKDLTIAIKNNIKKYKCRESHYGRGKSKRGMLVLKNLGIKVEKYYGSETDEDAENICKFNHKEVVYVGSITKLSNDEISKLKADLLICGSPFRDLYLKGTQNNFEHEVESKLSCDD
ncbi:hypothetical protein C0J52_12636 [Blattella germanica]|nr:hypothetical protein C0J52_12636 [Blattella germanica]